MKRTVLWVIVLGGAAAGFGWIKDRSLQYLPVYLLIVGAVSAFLGNGFAYPGHGGVRNQLNQNIAYEASQQDRRKTVLRPLGTAGLICAAFSILWGIIFR